MKAGVIKWQPDMFGNSEWGAGQTSVLTPFKLLPFFAVRESFGVVLVNCDLVEVLVRARVVREDVGWGHFPANNVRGG